MDDTAALIRRIRAPDASPAQRQAAVEALVVRYQDMAYGYAYALLGDPHLAQDAAQEAFITAYQRLDQLRDPRAFPAWFRRIILTHSQRVRRSQRFEPQPLDRLHTLPSDLPEPSALIERQEVTEHLQAAIWSLPTRQRVALVLCYLGGYAHQEVADFLDVSVDAVKKLLQRAREQMQERVMEMVRDELRRRRPSRDDRLVRAVRLFASLQSAAEQSQLETIELMLMDGLELDASGEHDQTLLHWAAEHGHVDAAVLLLEHGAAVNSMDSAGKTPLALAVERGQAAVADLLRAHGGRP